MNPTKYRLFMVNQICIQMLSQRALPSGFLNKEKENKGMKVDENSFVLLASLPEIIASLYRGYDPQLNWMNSNGHSLPTDTQIVMPTTNH